MTQPEHGKRVRHDGARRFGRKAVPPKRAAQHIAELHLTALLKRRQARLSENLAVLARNHRPIAEPYAVVCDRVVERCICFRFFHGHALVQIAHHVGVGEHRAKFGAVGVCPAAQRQARRDDDWIR